MRGYLVDTSITSLFAPGRSEATPSFRTWMRARNDRLHLSSITVFEAAQGIAKLRRQLALDRADRLAAWLEALIISFEPRVLHVDVEVARVAGALADRAVADGRHPGVADVLIAATAKAHGLTLLTHNLRHFEPLKIGAVDPLVSLPD